MANYSIASFGIILIIMGVLFLPFGVLLGLLFLAFGLGFNSDAGPYDSRINKGPLIVIGIIILIILFLNFS